MLDSNRFAAARNLIILAVVIALGIHAASAYAMYDQGDFARIISRALGPPISGSPEFPAMLWQHSAGRPIPNPSSGSVSFLFTGVAWAQRALLPIFHLDYWAVLARFLFAGSVLFFARTLIKPHQLGSFSFLIIGLFVLLVAFAPHNTAVFQSFYPEQVAFMALPLLCASFAVDGRWRLPIFVCSLLAIATAKAQYFYLPALAFMIVALFPAARPARLKQLALICVVLQLVAVLPLMRSTYLAVNHYNATYFGSYLELTPEEASRLGLNQAQRDCAGTDWWGNRVSSPTDVDAEVGDAACSTRNTVSAEAVFTPFIRFATLLPRMMLSTIKAHWTTSYFHLDKDVRYVREKAGQGFFSATMTLLDTAVSWLAVGPLAVIVFLSSIGLVVVQGVRDRSGTAAVAAFLLVLVVSQLFISLIGEGFRDLSKHLMLGVLSLELLSAVLAAALVRKFTR